MTYSIDELEERFKKHAKEFEEWHIQHPILENDDFNLSRALLSIVQEIKSLKESADVEWDKSNS